MTAAKSRPTNIRAKVMPGISVCEIAGSAARGKTAARMTTAVAAYAMTIPRRTVRTGVSPPRNSGRLPQM
jgi:hypothetical protein